MKQLEELVKERIEEEARLHMVKYYHHHGVEEDAWFYENIIKALTIELKGRVNEALQSSSGIGQTYNYLPREIVETKELYGLINEVIESLQNEHGHLLYGEEWRECDRHSPYIKLVKKRIAEEKSNWRLMLASSTGDVWSWEKSKRIYKEYDVAKIVNDEGAELIFDLPNELGEDDGWLHVLMFSIPVENQRGFFHTKKTFKSAVSTLAYHPSMRGLYSPCLTQIFGQPSAKNDDKKNNKSWRIKLNKYCGSDKDEWRLLTFWKRMGFVRPFLEDRHPDNIYLFNPEFTLKTKEAYLESGEENPFRHLRHSVYDRELEDLLLQ